MLIIMLQWLMLILRMCATKRLNAAALASHQIQSRSTSASCKRVHKPAQFCSTLM